MTRQRENFLVLMENWDSVSRYAQIAAESQGTAAEKMKAYTDSIEAAQQRTSVALEQLALDLNLTDALKSFYNALTYLVDNIEKVALALGGIILTAKGGDIMSSIGSGFTTLSNKAIGLNNIYSNILTGGINGEGIKAGLKNFQLNIEEEQKYLIGQKYVELMNRRAGLVQQSLQVEAEQLQTNLTGLNLDKSQFLVDNNLLGLSNKDYAQKMKNLMQSNQLSIEERRQILAIRNLVDSTDNLTEEQKKVALETAKQRKEEVSNTNFNPLSNIGGRLGSLAGFGLGSVTYGYAAEQLLGEGWGTIGSVIGSQMGMLGGQSFGETLASSLSGFINSSGVKGRVIGLIKPLFSSLGTIGGAAFIATAILAVYSGYKKAENEALERSKEKFKNLQEEYTQQLNQSVNVGEYDKLVKGVDSLGRNISLTDEEYQKFIETSNQLAEVFPDMVQRIDSSGNKLLGVKGKVTELTDAVNENIESLKKQRAEALIDSEPIKFFGQRGTTSQLEESAKELKKAEDEFNSIKNSLGQIQQDGFLAGKTSYMVMWAKENEKNQYKANGGWNFDNITEEDRTSADKWLENYLSKNSKAMETYNAYKKVLDEAKESMKAYTDAVIESDDTLNAYYNSLSDENKQLFDAVKNNIDWSSSKVDLFDKTAMIDYIKENLKEVQDLIEENPELEAQLKMYYDLQPEMNIKEYLDERNKMLETILSSGLEEKQLIKVMAYFQFTPVYNDDGSIKEWIDETNKLDALKNTGLINFISDKNAEEILSNSAFSYISKIFEYLNTQTIKVTQSLEDLNKVIAQNEIDGEPLLNLIDLYEKLEEKGVGSLDEIEKNQKKIIENQLDDWSDELKGIKGDYDDLIAKAKLIGNVNQFGIVEDGSFEDYKANAEDYQKYLDYLTNDYDGKTWNYDMYTKMIQDSDLAGFLYNNDIEGAKQQIQETLNTIRDGTEEYYQYTMGKSEEVTKKVLEDNKDLVQYILDNYNIDLKQFKTLEEAKQTISNITVENMEGQYRNWLVNLSINYSEALGKCSSAAEQLVLWNNIIFEQLEQMNGVGNVLSMEQLQKDYEQYKHFGGNEYNSLNEYVDAYRQRMFTNGVKKKSDELINSVKQIYNGIKLPEIDLNNIKKDKSSSSDKDLPDEKWKLTDRLEALEGLIDKEWEAMKVFDEFNGIEIKDTEYFKLMADSLNARLDQTIKETKIAKEKMLELKKIADSFGDANTKEAIEARNKFGDAEKEYIELQKTQISLQKQINNLDDEQAEDELKLAETKNYSLETLIKLNKELLNTSDTEEERVERNQKILDLMKQQYEEQKRIRDFYASFAESTRDLYSGTAYSNSVDYDTMMGYREAYNQKNIEAILNERNRLYSQNYERLLEEGFSPAEAMKKAMESEDVQNLSNDYLDAIKNASDIIIQGIDDKVAEIEQRISDLEKGKPQEWSNANQVRNYYGQTASLLNTKIAELQKGLSRVDELTDEQIQNLVNQLNDAVVALHEAQIQMQEDLINLQEKQYDAIVNRVNEYIQALNDEIDALDDLYDPILDKLKSQNDERTKAITLEEKLQAVQNAKKEKQRVNHNTPSIKVG